MSRTTVLFITLLIVIIAAKAFAIEHIHSQSLRDFDEARYAEVAHNIVRTGNWLIPMAGGPDEPRDTVYTMLPNGQNLYPYFWKPPLHPQIIAAFMHMVGVGELAVRLPTVLFALVACGFFYLLARRLYPELSWAPLVAVLFFVSSVDFSILLGQGLAEMQLLCFSLAALYCATDKTRTGAVWAGLAFGLAFLTKSFITFWVPPVVALLLFDVKHLKEWMIRLVWFGIAAVVMILPWHLLMVMEFGQSFVEHYLLTNSAGRTSGATGNIAPPQWYFIYMLDQWKPFIFIVPALAGGILASLRNKEKSTWMLVLWSLIVLIPLSIARSKVYWYMFPVWIPFTLLLAVFLERAYRSGRTYVIAAAIVFALFSLHSYWQLNPQYIPLKSFAAFVVLGSGVSWWLWGVKQASDTRVLFAVICALIFVLANIASVGSRLRQTDENRDLRTLLLRHPDLPELTPVSYPYEAALFYSRIGNMQLYTPQAQYIFTAAPLEDPTIRSQFMAIDEEGRFVLYRKIR